MFRSAIGRPARLRPLASGGAFEGIGAACSNGRDTDCWLRFRLLETLRGRRRYSRMGRPGSGSNGTNPSLWYAPVRSPSDRRTDRCAPKTPKHRLPCTHAAGGPKSYRVVTRPASASTLRGARPRPRPVSGSPSTRTVDLDVGPTSRFGAAGRGYRRLNRFMTARSLLTARDLPRTEDLRAARFATLRFPRTTRNERTSSTRRHSSGR